MKQKLKEILIQAAKSRMTCSYYSVAKKLNLRYSEKRGYGDAFFKTMMEIGKEEFEAGRPLLNALIVNDDKLPGIGFFNWLVKVVDVKAEIRSMAYKKQLATKLQNEAFEYWME